MLHSSGETLAGLLFFQPLPLALSGQMQLDALYLDINYVFSFLVPSGDVALVVSVAAFSISALTENAFPVLL